MGTYLTGHLPSFFTRNYAKFSLMLRYGIRSSSLRNFGTTSNPKPIRLYSSGENGTHNTTRAVMSSKRARTNWSGDIKYNIP
jgi:hypothetical protein